MLGEEEKKEEEEEGKWRKIKGKRKTIQFNAIVPV
jgi:hypothetical protein